MTSRRVIGKLKGMFVWFGIPEKLCTDNAQQFTSVEFKAFAEKYGFVHVASSPHCPQSNGEAEQAVQTAKKILKLNDPFLALLTYRATLIASTGCSPSQLLMGRHLRTTVPTIASNLVPAWPDFRSVEEKDRKAKESYQYFFNHRHGARSLSPLCPGDPVRIKLDGEKGCTTKGTVSRQAEQPRSYYIETDQGELRRNRKHLQAIPVLIQHHQEPPDCITDAKEESSPMVVSEPLPERNKGTSSPSAEATVAIPRTPDHATPKTTCCGCVIRKPLRYQS